MNFATHIHHVGGHILLLSDKPDDNTSNGHRYWVKKVIASGPMQHFNRGQFIYKNDNEIASYKDVIRTLFMLDKINGIKKLDDDF